MSLGKSLTQSELTAAVNSKLADVINVSEYFCGYSNRFPSSSVFKAELPH